MPRRRRPGVLPSMSHTGIFIVRHHLHSSDIRGLCLTKPFKINILFLKLCAYLLLALLIYCQFLGKIEAPLNSEQLGSTYSTVERVNFVKHKPLYF